MKTKHLCLAGALFVLPYLAHASSGTEGASFLDIPVGAAPAALGSAYSALATNAYAPVWNPAGLSSVQGTEIASQHLSYLESINYEFLSIAHNGFGFSAQYLGSGDITKTDVSDSGNPVDLGSYSSHYGAYNLSYGRHINDKLALGLTGKWINAKIDNVSANAYAMDLGSLYQVTDKITLAGTLTNVGTQLKFLDNGDALPMAFHVGAAYKPDSHFLLSTEGVYERNGMASFHAGTEWRPVEMLALRAGYRTDTLKGLSPIAGLSTGLGLYVWGQEFSYAWVPYGDLGNTQYFSLLVRFGVKDEERRNLIQYQTIKRYQANKKNDSANPDMEYEQLMQLLNDDGVHVAQAIGK